MTAARDPLAGAVAPEPASAVVADTPNALRGSQAAPLFVVAESADGDLLYDPADGSCRLPAHWLLEKEMNR